MCLIGRKTNLAPLIRTAKEAKAYTLRMTILKTAVIGMVIITTLAYIISVFYTKFGSFTVSVNKYDTINRGLTLSEEPNFDHKTTRLNAKSAKDCNNIAESELPDNLDNINGSHNGENYIAYTFYVTNAGAETVTFEYDLHMANVTQALDDAIRIRVYRDGVPEVFAKTRTDGTGPEAGTTEFLTSSVITRKQVENFKPGDVMKFTVVIWIEGNDDDCKDDKIGGQLKVDMTMSIIG